MEKRKAIYVDDLRQAIVEDKEIRGTAFSAIMKHLNAAPDVERCVCCGEIIPEGRQVCPNCENKAKQPQKVKTRADQIREMTDEELADFLLNADEGNLTVDVCAGYCVFDDITCPHNCKEAIMNYLRSSAKSQEW